MIARKISFTAAALSDLRGIRSYIGWDHPGVAERIASGIVRACDRLVSFPDRGRPGRTPGTREIVADRQYVIVYRVTSAEVEILRVWHGARDRGQPG